MREGCWVVGDFESVVTVKVLLVDPMDLCVSEVPPTGLFVIQVTENLTLATWAAYSGNAVADLRLATAAGKSWEVQR